jgi:hypothetical protein
MLARISPLRALLVGFVLIGAVQAQAAIVTYADRTTWLSNVSGVTTLGFEGIADSDSDASDNFVDYGGDAESFGSEATFRAAGGRLYVVDPSYGPSLYDWGTGAVLNVSYGTPTELVVTPIPGARAFGVDLTTFFVGSAGVVYGRDVYIAMGTFNLTLPTGTYPNRTFFGLVSDAPLDPITFTVGADTEFNEGSLNVDDFSFATNGSGGGGDPIPEPASLLLLGTGLLGVSRLRRRR